MTQKNNNPEPTGLFKAVISFLQPETQLFHVRAFNVKDVEDKIREEFGHLISLEIENVELIDGEESEQPEESNVVPVDFTNPKTVH